MSESNNTVTPSTELVEQCSEFGHKRVQYLHDELAKAEAAGDLGRVERLITDLVGDDAACYVDHPGHKQFLALLAGYRARMRTESQ
jgi:hypothetical protein